MAFISFSGRTYSNCKQDVPTDITQKVKQSVPKLIETSSILPKHMSRNFGAYFAFCESHAHKYPLNRIRASNWS